jgi:hypothetical protein
MEHGGHGEEDEITEVVFGTNHVGGASSLLPKSNTRDQDDMPRRILVFFSVSSVFHPGLRGHAPVGGREPLLEAVAQLR